MGDSDVIGRLRNGRSITLRTADRITAYMNAERTRRAEPGARRSTACEGGDLSEAEHEDREAALERAPSWVARFLAWFRPAFAERYVARRALDRRAKLRLRAGRP